MAKVTTTLTRQRRALAAVPPGVGRANRLARAPTRRGRRPAGVAILLATCLLSRAAEAPFDYFDNSWSLIGLKDYPAGTRLTPQNELLLADNLKVRLRVGPAQTALSRAQTKTLLEGWLPVVLLTTEQAGVCYEFALWATPLPQVKDWRAAFAWPTEGENFMNWIEVRARNPGNQRGEASVRLERAGTNATPLAEWRQTLGPRQTATACFRVPFAPVAGTLSASNCLAPAAEAKRWRERTVAFWRGLLAGGAQIEVPCPKATQALRAAHVAQFITNDRGVLKGGEGFYDEFYIRDGAYQILQFEEGGFAEAARRAIEPYWAAQRPEGRFETQKGQLDANGQALWALWQYWKITGDRSFLQRAYLPMRRAVVWLQQARREAPSDSPFAGLLPCAVADGEYLWDGRHHIVGYDFWNLRGLECAADAAEALGETTDAREFRREAEDYRRALDAAGQRTGLAHFPPSWEKVGTHWGNTETLWPTELFAPDDPRVTALLREVRQQFLGGFREGTIRWGGYPDVIHPYLSAYTTMASLARGEHEAFVADFYWYLLHSTATHAFPEGIYYRKRTAWNDAIPHPTGAANYALLLRHALVHERGSELHLLPGAPDAWLEAGRQIRVERAPTHFGPLSLRVRGTAHGVEVQLDPPRRSPPQRVVLHLPGARPLARGLPGVEVSWRAAQTQRWDFPAVVERYQQEVTRRGRAPAGYDLNGPGKWRGVHLLAPAPEELPLLRRAIAEQLAPLGVNTLVFEVGYRFQFTARPEMRDPKGWSRAQARELAACCRAHGIRLIPQLNCLGHQSSRRAPGALLAKHPELDETPDLSYDAPGFKLRNWCPLHPEVNTLVFALLDELIDAFQADAFHVGMDEVFYLAHDGCPRCRGKLPEALFARAVNDYHAHLVGRRGLTMLMWGDRLLDDAAMKYGEWESSRVGTANAVDLIPRDIIICDWHYGLRKEYPSVVYLQEKGFRVWPASWKNRAAALALRNYAARHATDRLLGHLGTVWGASSTFARALLGEPGVAEDARLAAEALRAVLQEPLPR